MTKTLTLTYKDLLEDKLSRRSKADLDKLRICMSKEQNSDKKSSNLYDLNFPSYLTVCGHIHDFVELIEQYNVGHQWMCPTCKCRLASLKQIKVFKQEDLKMDKKEPQKIKTSTRVE